jgi:ATP-dependent exoDNAse (exonuclease V) beta subunit
LSEQAHFTVYNASAGSGKTFTLVRDYLTLLLDPAKSVGFQRILAITFTNKAAGEMKDRVLDYLVEFATGADEDANDMKQHLMDQCGLSPVELQAKSLEVLQQILKDYSSFNIRTIDSFTNKLIKAFAFDLGLSMDFEVELDTDSLFQEAVDELISQIGQDDDITRILVAFARQKADEDRSWDITRDLFEISQLLLNENHLHEIEQLREKNISDFRNLYRTLIAERKKIQSFWKEKGKEALDLMASKGLSDGDFFSKQAPKFFRKMEEGASGLEFSKGSSLDKNMDAGKFYAQSKKQSTKDAIDAIAGELVRMYRESEERFGTYYLYGLILKNLVPLAVLSSIYKILEEIKTENNIRLNAEFNQLISKHLRDQPAAFIYEKIGEKFKYFFIDEMQDTSVLQWLNLIPLLGNALSGSGAGLMLVGDAKQAIYRWRGGRAEQFIDLASERQTEASRPFVVEKRVRDLETNYRSYSEIIGFNNDLFSYISSFFRGDSYKDLYRRGNDQRRNKRSGGYVELQFLPAMRRAQEKDEAYSEAVLKKTNELLKEFQPEEICILVRKRSQGTVIAKALMEEGIDILSSETLLLKNNTKVAFIIEFLRFQENPDNKEALFEVLSFLYSHWNVQGPEHAFYETHLNLDWNPLMDSFEGYGFKPSSADFSTFSVYEQVEALIRGFGLSQGSDAFLQYFLDFVFDYTQRRSQKNLGFLEFWEEKKDKLNITSSEEAKAIRIMTIHKSKGLEFPVVIFPYDMQIYGERIPSAWYEPLEGDAFKDFPSLLVAASSKIQLTGKRGEEIFEELQTEQELDSINLLYVCLTRAVEQLHVITEIRKNSVPTKTTSDLLSGYLKSTGLWEDGKSVYCIGSKQRVSLKEPGRTHSLIQKELISTSWMDHDLHLVSKASELWDTRQGEAITFGNRFHELMAQVQDRNDLKRVVEASIGSGFLESSEREHITSVLRSLVEHPELREQFDPGLEVLNERQIFVSEGIAIIPDRLVFRGRCVWIIDYKTGAEDPEHVKQINHYAQVMRQMGYEVVECLLVYVNRSVHVVKIDPQKSL